jgi:hypothetical protein
MHLRMHIHKHIYMHMYTRAHQLRVNTPTHNPPHSMRISVGSSLSGSFATTCTTACERCRLLHATPVSASSTGPTHRSPRKRPRCCRSLRGYMHTHTHAPLCTPSPARPHLSIMHIIHQYLYPTESLVGNEGHDGAGASHHGSGMPVFECMCVASNTTL